MKNIVMFILAALLLAPEIATAAERRATQDPPAVSTKVLPLKLDLNRASLDQLVGVPGIGPRMAQSIIDLRLKKGSFKHVEDLLEVTGIKKKKFASIAGYFEIVPLPAAVATSPATLP